ncbi:MAG: GNAT family N-acetyltransferase [Hyphomicrobiaceae bacterium]|nr:GNAT family N-acetyltransferase [Hyphomicrobiaceae bacterium]
MNLEERLVAPLECAAGESGAAASLSVHAHVGLDALCACRDAWEALAEAAEVGPFQRPGLLIPLARELYSEDDAPVPFLVEVREQDRPIAFLPLIRLQRRGLDLVQWLGEPICEYGDMIADPRADRAGALEAALADKKALAGVDVIQLRKVRADAQIAPAFSYPGAIALEPREAPYIALSRYPTLDAYHATLNARSRKSRRRARRKMEEAGSLSFTVLKPGEEAAMMTGLAIAYKKAWLEAEGLASRTFMAPVNTRSLMAMAETPGTGCRVSVLKLGDAPAAIEIGFIAGGDYLSYLAAMAPDHIALGPGKIQLEETLVWASGENIRRFDLLAPADPYKLGWAEDQIGVSDLVLPRSLAGKLHTALFLKMLRPGLKGLFHMVPRDLRRVVAKKILHG